MLPYFAKNSDNLSICLLFRQPKRFIYILLFIVYPRFLSSFISPFSRIFSKYIFIRNDLDHFGPWMHLVVANNYLSKKYPHKVQIVLASRFSIDSKLAASLSFRNLYIIYNPFLQFLLSPLFFLPRNTYDINGSIILSNRKFSTSYSRINSVPPIDDFFLSNYSCSSIHNKLSFSSGYCLFFARSGVWKHSASNSKRNMPDFFTHALISTLLKYIDVVVISPPPNLDLQKFASSQHKIYNFDVLVSSFPAHHIYSCSTAVVGSVSGATHFPSIVFNKKTLYFADLPLEHLNQYYLPPSFSDQIESNLSVPHKDRWYILPKNTLISLSSLHLDSIVTSFLNNKPAYLPPGHSCFFFSKPFINFSRTLHRSTAGNVILPDL